MLLPPILGPDPDGPSLPMLTAVSQVLPGPVLAKPALELDNRSMVVSVN